MSGRKIVSDSSLPACRAENKKLNLQRKVKKLSSRLFHTALPPARLLLHLTGIQTRTKCVSDKIISDRIDGYCLLASSAVLNWEKRFQKNFIVSMILNSVILLAGFLSIRLETVFVPGIIALSVSAVMIVRAAVSWTKTVRAVSKNKAYIKQYAPVVFSHLKQRKIQFRQKCRNAAEEIFYDIYDTRIKPPVKTGHKILSALGMVKSKQEIAREAAAAFSETFFSSGMKFIAAKAVIFSFFTLSFAFVLKPLAGMSFFQIVFPK